jgi:uncharacterized membrane protein
MQLLMLLLVLMVPSRVLALAQRWVPGFRMSHGTRARVGVSLFFGVTSSGHFAQTNAMAEMLPPFVPFRRAIIYITGVLQLLGAVGLWVPRLERLTGLYLTLMMIGLLPANVYAAFKRVSFGGHGRGPVYLLVRVPFQLLVIWRIYTTVARIKN